MATLVGGCLAAVREIEAGICDFVRASDTHAGADGEEKVVDFGEERWAAVNGAGKRKHSKVKICNNCDFVDRWRVL